MGTLLTHVPTQQLQQQQQQTTSSAATTKITATKHSAKRNAGKQYNNNCNTKESRTKHTHTHTLKQQWLQRGSQMSGT